MKIKDLVEELSKLDPDMEVLCRHVQIRGYISYHEGKSSLIRPQRMVKIHKYQDDELVDVEYDTFENYKYRVHFDDSKEYLILNSEDKDEDEEEE